MSREKDTPEQRGTPKPRESSMLQAALLARIRENGGGQIAYSRYLGVSSSTMLSWINDGVNPLHRADTREKVTADLGLGLTQLMVLGDVSIRDACDIVLEAKAAEDPVEKDLHDRFFSLMVEHGTAIPPAAYMIFLIGDQQSRAGMVQLLEEQGVTGAAPTPSGLQAALDILPKPPGT